MNVLITGSNGFIAKNLIERLSSLDDIEIMKFDRNHSQTDLGEMVLRADFIYHLAGVNRPKDSQEFYDGNSALTKQIVDILISNDKNTPIVMTSSIQATRDNDYGKSKLQAENELKRYSDAMGATVYIYRLPNVFGKWCRPNYNSVVATWCYNIVRDLPIIINDESVVLSLVYVEDVVEEFVKKLFENSDETKSKYYDIPIVYQRSLAQIYESLNRFNTNDTNTKDDFEYKLYQTYIEYKKEAGEE